MTSLAGPPSREERTRVAVGLAAVAAVAVAIAGVVVLLTSFKREPVWWAGWGLVLLALVAAVGCLRHGARNEHERGRWPAVVALLIGLPVFLSATYGAGTDGCRLGAVAIGCVDIGREPDR